jgi:glucose/arabinose dehydrogenase
MLNNQEKIVSKKNPLLQIIGILALLYTSNNVFAQDIRKDTVEIIKTKSGEIKVEHLTALVEPWGMAWLPDNRLLITEKPGRLRIYSQGNLLESVKGLPKIEYHGQGGLLDVKLDPDFINNKFIYISYTEAAEVQPDIKRDVGDPRLGKFNDFSDAVLKGGAVARGKLVGNEIQNLQVIWRQVPKTIGRGHFGGRLLFAPDGKLIITSAERQRSEPAQDLASNLGKIIRINSDGSIPKDNPFVNRKDVRPEIWTYGNRNPLGIAFNPVTKQLFSHEMGALHGDEFNIILPGKNYGWPIVSNGDHYNISNIPDHETKPQYEKPIYYWHPAISPSGLIFYTGELFKSWYGNALLGSFNSEALVVLKIVANNVSEEERIALHRRIRDVIQAPDGSVWLLTDYKEGELIRISPVKE